MAETCDCALHPSATGRLLDVVADLGAVTGRPQGSRSPVMKAAGRRVRPSPTGPCRRTSQVRRTQLSVVRPARCCRRCRTAQPCQLWPASPRRFRGDGLMSRAPKPSTPKPSPAPTAKHGRSRLRERPQSQRQNGPVTMNAAVLGHKDQPGPRVRAAMKSVSSPEGAASNGGSHRRRASCMGARLRPAESPDLMKLSTELMKFSSGLVSRETESCKSRSYPPEPIVST